MATKPPRNTRITQNNEPNDLGKQHIIPKPLYYLSYMIQVCAYIVLLFAGPILALEPISITGQITNPQGKPLPSIVVQLAQQGLADTTNAQGFFRLEQSATGNPGPTTALQAPRHHTPIMAPQKQYLANGKTVAPQWWHVARLARYAPEPTPTYSQPAALPISQNTAPLDELHISQNGQPLASLPVMSFSASLGAIAVTPTQYFVDPRDNRLYPYIELGGQYWMAQNLNYGTRVAASNGMLLDNLVEKYCIGDDSLGCNQWGALYKWAEAMALPHNCNSYTCAQKIHPTGHQGLCPDGWNLPTPADWNTLVANINNDPSTVAPQLKSDTGWTLPQHNGTNSSGFSALPSGNRNAKSQFVNQGQLAYWWTAEESNASMASVHYLYGSKDDLFASQSAKNDNGFSVRCFYNGPLDNGELPIQPGEGYVIWEKWKHIRGPSLAKVPWNTQPHDTGTVYSLSTPNDFDDRFGLRIRGYITAPASGYYQFKITTNGTATFSLSTNSAVNQLVAILPTANTASAPIYLNRGVRYYFDTRWKESWQADHFAIQWNTPEDNDPNPFSTIPGEWLSPVPLTWLKTTPAVCETIQPTHHEDNWPAYCHAAEGNCGTFIDERNCQEYRWTQIGTQKWMAENLNIGTMVDGALDQDDDAVIEKYCYGNNAANCDVYGGLYQWHEAMGLDDSCMTKSCWENSPKYGVQGICPDGWVMPAQSDMQNLIDRTTGLDSTAANPLKSKSWLATGTDPWGFSALPSGYRNSSNTYIGIGTQTQWWLSEELLSGHAWLQKMDATAMLSRSYAQKQNQGLGIRCVSAGSQTIWGNVTWERWDGSYTRLTIPENTPPSASGKWSTFEAPSNIMDNYAYVVKATFTPPNDGNYVFYVAADDQADLYLSNTPTPTMANRIVSQTAWTNSRGWNNYSSQKSAPIHLTTGSNYYLTVKMTEGNMGDVLTLGFSNLSINPTKIQVLLGKHVAP